MIPDDVDPDLAVPDPAAPAGTPAYTTLWKDLVSIDDAPAPTVGIVKDGAVVWSRPLAELLGPDATLDNGWYASEDDGAVPVLQLSATVGWKSNGTSYPALDLATNLITVGINSDDGTVIWQEPGTSPQCRYQLPSVQDMSTPGSENPALRCRYTGRLDSVPAGYRVGLSSASELSVTVERVDLQTGKAIWSVPLGAVPALAVNSGGVPATLLDDHRLLANGQVLDLDGGSVRPPAAGETFWCPESQTFTQTSGLTYADGSTRYDRRIEGEVFACDQAGNPVTGPPTAVPLAVSTVTDGGLRMVSTRSGVIAYRVPRVIGGWRSPPLFAGGGEQLGADRPRQPGHELIVAPIPFDDQQAIHRRIAVQPHQVGGPVHADIAAQQPAAGQELGERGRSRGGAASGPGRAGPGLRDRRRPPRRGPVTTRPSASRWPRSARPTWP